MSRRTIVWFSCGAASASAARLVLKNQPNALLVYCDTGSEHSDNKRFKRECETWLKKKVVVIKSKTYKNVVEVFTQNRFIVSPKGAMCTAEMKKVPRYEFQRADDIHIFGYVSGEEDRYERFQRGNPDVDVRAPLIEAGLTKDDCLGIIQRAGIDLPAMYKLGYTNNNCIGCVKGGAGYWNKIRIDFPYTFWQMAELERELNLSILKKNGKKMFLDELPKDAGNYGEEPKPHCSLLCEQALIKGA